MSKYTDAIKLFEAWLPIKYKPTHEAVTIALSALREADQREKGCEYCAEGEDLAYGHDSMQRTGRIYLDGNLLTADLYSESMAVAVCFCPICGKELIGGDTCRTK